MVETVEVSDTEKQVQSPTSSQKQVFLKEIILLIPK